MSAPTNTESTKQPTSSAVVSDPVLPVSAPQQQETARPLTRDNLGAFLQEEVDLDLASIPLSLFCFMTGYIDAVTFTACFIWCAFQTGNTIQLSLAIARLFTGDETGTGFHMPDRQALVSLFAFLGGAFIGRLGDRFGPKKRGWLVVGTLLQAGLTLAAALTAKYSHQSGFASDRGDPSWTNSLGFLTLAFASASMGLQAHGGTRMGAQFATTVVLTTIWVQFIAEPKLFEINHTYKPRDYKALAIISLFIGGLIGRALTNTIGAAGTFGLGAGLRVLIAATWLLIPKAKKRV